MLFLAQARTITSLEPEPTVRTHSPMAIDCANIDS